MSVIIYFRHTPTSTKENRSPGLDPRLLQPSPVLANGSRQNLSARNRGGGGRGAPRGGLLRSSGTASALAGQNVNVPPPESVYFAKT